MVWLSTYSMTENQWNSGTPTPLIYDYASKAECETAAAEFIGSRAADDFKRYGYAVEFVNGNMHKNYRCIRGPRK